LSASPLTIIAALGTGAIAIAIGVNVIHWKDEIEKSPQPVDTISNSTKSNAALSSSEKKLNNVKIKKHNLPTFDVVRIGPSGNSVIAGRAVPGSTVIIKDDGKSIGQIKADKRGEWVFLPKSPLPQGTRKLSLEMILDNGDRLISNENVLLVAPDKEKKIAKSISKSSNIIALKIPKNEGSSTLLQSPGSLRPEGLSIETIDYGDTASMFIKGKADANALINIYLEDNFIGQAKTNKQGIWQLKPNKKIAPGLYSLRADQVNENGKVMARVSIPFSRAEPTTNLQTKPFVTVQPGNSLWRLAYKAYGKGMRYTTIFQANKDQIKDPDLIYPGQIFTIPTEK